MGAYDPDTRERRVRAEAALRKPPGDLTAQGAWQRDEDGSIQATQAGARLRLAFDAGRRC